MTCFIFKISNFTFIETSPKTPTPQSSQSDVKISMLWTRNGEESTLPPNIDTKIDIVSNIAWQNIMKFIINLFQCYLLDIQKVKSH